MLRQVRETGGTAVSWVAVMVAAASLLGGCSEVKKLVLFSAVEGQLLDGGQPIAGVKIERSWFWHNRDQRGGDTATTDRMGMFSLPAITSSSLRARLVPHEPVIEQLMTVSLSTEPVRLWSTFKRNYVEGGELNRHARAPSGPLRLVCDLSVPGQPPDDVVGQCRIVADPGSDD